MKVLIIMNDDLKINDQLPFENQSVNDTPLYESVGICFEINNKYIESTDVEDEMFNSVYNCIEYNREEFITILPAINTKVSNVCEHKSLRGKQIPNSVYYFIVGNHRPSWTFSHKALCLGSLKVNPRGKSWKSVTQDPLYRSINTNFDNPNWNDKIMVGINMHRGPHRNKRSQNYSLGCITNDRELFDIFMKLFSYDDVGLIVKINDDFQNNSTSFKISEQKISSLVNMIHERYFKILKKEILR